MAEPIPSPDAIAISLLRAGRSLDALGYITSLPASLRTTQSMQRMLAAALSHQGRFTEAADVIETAAMLRDAQPATIALAAKMALDQRRFDQAYVSYSRLVKTQPVALQSWTGLFDSAAKINALQDAMLLFERYGSPEISSDSMPLAVRIDAALIHLTRYDAALAHVTQVAEKHTEDATARRLFIRRSVELSPMTANPLPFAAFNPQREALTGELVDAGLALPQIFASEQQVIEWRARVMTEVQAFTTWVRSQPRDAGVVSQTALQLLTRVPFFMAYHGLDDLPFQRAWAGFIESIVEVRSPPALTSSDAASRDAPATRSGSRLRLGIVSAHLRECTVGNYFAAWFDGLTNGQFEVNLYSIDKQDGFTERLAQRAQGHKHFRNGMDSYELMKKAIHADDNDVLLYPEIGMEPLVLALAATRIAPHQVAAWGHPVTTGLSTIDYFVSAEAAEPENAQTHYTERLIKLPGMGTRFPAPPPTKTVSRSALAVTDDQPLLLCAQSLFKWSPKFVAALGHILKARPKTILVYFAIHRTTPPQVFAQMLSDAWTPLGVDAAQRTRVLGEMQREEFLAHLAVCDVALDTFGFSGGQTSIDTLSANVPAVTLPGIFMRGRQTAAMLTTIGVDELVARDEVHYQELVLQLIDNAPQRDALREKISRNNSLLFNDQRAVTALVQWLSTLRSAPPPASQASARTHTLRPPSG